MEFTNIQIADEIKSLVLQIGKIDEEIKRGIINFKQTYKNCDFVSEWQGQGLNYPQYLKLVCEKGYPYFKSYILNPLLVSLLDYMDHLLGTKAYTASYKTKMQGMLSSIHRYVVVTSFFGKDPSYMVPGNTQNEIKYRNEFKNIILTTNRRLMGCDSSHKFPIQSIAKSFEMTDDHKRILQYMLDQCIFLKKELI